MDDQQASAPQDQPAGQPPPPGAPLPPQDTIARTGFDIHGNPAATPGQKKPFLLDPLLQ